MIHYITGNGIGNPWVAAELQMLQAQGVRCALHAMRAPGQHFFRSEWATQMNRETRVLYPLRPLSVAWSLLLAPLLFRGRLISALTNALFSQRESLRTRVAGLAHLVVACDWARRLRKEPVDLIHSQWIHSNGTIGWYAARLLGKPFSFTGHAVDLFRDRCALNDKIRDADLIIAISEFHRDFYIEAGSAPDKIHIVYCGIDLKGFHFAHRPIVGIPRILSFGRLVEKKGFDTLIQSCRVLHDRGVELSCEIAGSGPEEPKLRELIERLGLKDTVVVTGRPLLQEEIPDWLDQGHIFAQPCCWSSDNDVDGIPRSLMEAMAVGLPSVATRVAGLPDLVRDGESGLLVEPRDPNELADAIERLINDADLSKKLSQGGRDHVECFFNLDTCLEPLAELFNSRLQTTAQAVQSDGHAICEGSGA